MAAGVGYIQRLRNTLDVQHRSKESKSNKNADSYLRHGNNILVAPPGGQSVMDINAD